MRTLVLMRHAKTESFNAAGDKSRELTPRGRSDAAEAGIELADAGLQLALCSTATRARQTLRSLGLRTADGEALPAEFMDIIYSGGSDDILSRIGEVEDDVTGLLVVGHAPTIPGLSAELTWASDRSAADAQQCHFPPAHYTRFEFEQTWSELAAGNLASVRLVGQQG